MAFPSEVEALALGDLAALQAHVGIAQEALDAVWAGTGSPDNSVHNVALLDAPVIRAAITAARVGNDAAILAGTAAQLTPMQAAQVGLVWRVCSRLAFTRAGGAWDQWPDCNPLDPAQGVAGTALAPPGQVSRPAVVLPVAAGPGRTVKLASVLDQGDHTEVALASQSDMDMWHAAHITAMGAAPAEAAEPTLEQASALDNRIKAGLSPYADFAVFVPYGRRGLRAMRFRTWTPVGDGTYTSKEVPGPENWMQWEAAWDLFTATMLMLSAAGLSALTAYKNCVKQLAILWPDCWHLVAMADDKMRAEQWSRIKRCIANEVTGGAPPPAGYTAAHPWSAVIRRSCEDSKFWNEQVRYPAAAWVARGARGVQLAPEERLAQAILPGGMQSIEPEYEDLNSSSTAKKRKQNFQDSPGFQQSSKQKGAKHKGKDKGGQPRRGAPTGGGKNGAGKDKDIETDTCLNWDLKRGSGPCAKATPGSPCTAGRKHVCRTCGQEHRTADHDQFQ